MCYLPGIVRWPASLLSIALMALGCSSEEKTNPAAGGAGSGGAAGNAGAGGGGAAPYSVQAFDAVRLGSDSQKPNYAFGP